jgi:signal transduction histidine kinase
MKEQPRELQSVVSTQKEICVTEMYDFVNLTAVNALINKGVYEGAIKNGISSFFNKRFSIYCKDIKGKYLACNQYMLKAIGLSQQEEIIGKTDKDFIWKEFAPQLRAADLCAMESGEVICIEEVGEVSGESGPHFFSSVKQPLTDDFGNVLGVFGISENITQQRKIIENLQQETQKRTYAEEDKHTAAMFSGSTSHDIKNELQMLGFLTEQLQMAGKKAKEEGVAALSALELRWMFENPDKIAEVKNKIDEIVSYSNEYLRDLTMGGVDLEKKYRRKTAIHKCVREAISIFDYRDDIRIHNQIQNGFECMGATMAIYKIIVNLFSNAIRQIEKKEKGEIFITTAEDQDHYILKIKDTAGGLTAERVAELFQSFQEKAVEGTGFGLASSQILMQKMGGALKASLVDGDKIEFLLYFPKI